MTAQAAIRGQEVVTRFAPSPTGQLHLGHGYSAVLAHDFAVAYSGRFLLRIEDIDGTRSRPGHVETILADLAWLGLAHAPPVFQSARLNLYADALERLKVAGLVYPCFCTRAEIAAASLSAPHGVEAVYPGTCRGIAAPDLARPHCWRLDVAKALDSFFPGEGRGPVAPSPVGEDITLSQGTSILSRGLRRGGGGHPMELSWHDASAGWIQADPLAHGDVILARKDAPASYHLAVTVDDAAQGVTDVVRGMDLFRATDVHRLLQTLLGLPSPRYHHHPLLTGADGERLAKRHGSPTLAALREAGEDGRSVARALRLGILPTGFAVAAP
ncbi:glutamyl-Q tRNA(Asp) synthetase [Sphingomonas sp.]|uniref:glutamyl-Q tRNA(Asp) synthetase n=1 Tax=Sphingomonas sp. TaxID=28214 RepID=UPI002D7E4455|nr:glutamyl-Q tRNA(Asp) synthetase [Sphingomonas sp.]HEU0045576.1 glutamyl-Q tRNA(Asp) synthetase [Sphingomonas sp.]